MGWFIDWADWKRMKWNEDSSKPINNKLLSFKEKSEVVDGVACCWRNERNAAPRQLHCRGKLLNKHQSNEGSSGSPSFDGFVDGGAASSFSIKWVMAAALYRASTPLQQLNHLLSFHAACSFSFMNQKTKAAN